MDGTLCLAIESAGVRASVALLRGADRLGFEVAASNQHHSETLLVMVDRLLQSQGVALNSVDAFAIAVWPGAFTSLRIGLATLKGLAFNSGQPVAPVSTLEALAWTASFAPGVPAGRGPCLAAIDARQGRLYGWAFRVEAAGRLTADPRVPEGAYTPEQLKDLLPEGARVVGNGAAVLAGSDLDFSPAWQFEAAPHTWPDANAVGQLGLARLARGEGREVAALEPRYLHRPQAEQVLLARTAQED